MALVDIILPTKNNGLWLQQAVASLLSQDFQDTILWIIDDHTSDESLNNLPHDPRIRIVPATGHGLVEALNQGLRLGHAPWILRSDGDDINHPKRLSRQLKAATSNNWDWVSCGVQAIETPDPVHGYPEYTKWHNQLLTAPEMRNNRFIECPMIHPTWLLKRKVFQEQGFYHDKEMPEDYEFFLRCSEHYRLGKIPEVLLEWRDHTHRASRRLPAYHAEAFRRVKAAYFPLKPGTPFSIWGGGPGGRRLARTLIQEGFQPEFFVDIDPRKIGRTIYNISTLSPESYYELPHPPFIITAVMQRGARLKLSEWFKEKGYSVAKNYYHFH